MIKKRDFEDLKEKVEWLEDDLEKTAKALKILIEYLNGKPEEKDKESLNIIRKTLGYY